MESSIVEMLEGNDEWFKVGYGVQVHIFLRQELDKTMIHVHLTILLYHIMLYYILLYYIIIVLLYIFFFKN